jgi:hypothetical protein
MGSAYEIVAAEDVEDAYAGTDVPGEFRRLTEALGCSQVALTLIRVPPHSDFEQGTGHRHEETEEVYLVTRGTLTMRFGDDVREVRNCGEEPVEVWAISRKRDGGDSTKVDDFWEASPEAAQTR